MENEAKNPQEIAREILDNRDFEPTHIKIAPEHRERIEQVAQAMDLTVPETATFLLYSMINDMELAARQAQMQNLNPN